MTVPLNHALTASQNASQWIEGLKFALMNLLLPVVVAVVTYILVDRLGEWRKRRTYSKLGVAIFESLQEEIRTGISLISTALTETEKQPLLYPPLALPSTKSWSGMSTIPDDVLLRIIETSANQTFKGFQPRDSRIHCKNYFENMCQNYEQAVRLSTDLARQGQDWRPPLCDILSQNRGNYIEAARGVDQMLERAKELLKKNSKAFFPK